MANEELVEQLRSGSYGRDSRPEEYAGVVLDLRGALLQEADLVHCDLSRADLSKAELQGAHMMHCNLNRAQMHEASLMGADLRGAILTKADLRGVKINDARAPYADFSGAQLQDAHLWGSDFREAIFRGADLSGANLQCTQLVRTDLSGATLTGCSVYGIAAWNPVGQPEDQTDLVITPQGQPAVTVDDIEVAQFMYLMLHNEKLRRVIDTITSKVVLILGRFTPERKAMLDALRNELRHHNLTPVLFDFDVPADRDITETVTLLARMARFIVADLTDPASIPMELQAIAPHVAVPIRAIVHENQEPFSMFRTLHKYHWVLPPHKYGDQDELLANLDTTVIGPAEAKRRELLP